MTNKYLFGAVMAGLSLTAMAAAPQFKLPAVGGEPVKQVRPTDCKKLPNKARQASSRLSDKQNGPARSIGLYGSQCEDILKYGTLTLLLEEDFSLLTTGTEAKPDLRTNLIYDWNDPEFTYPWWNFRPEFTHTPNWGTGNAYPAGGCLYFPCEESEAHVNTPLVDCTGADGHIAVLEFRARAWQAGSTYDALLIETAETNNMGPSWIFNEESVIFTDIPSEWSTYRVVFRDCGPSQIFNICAIAPGYMLIDDVKVYQLNPNVGIPEVLPHTDYKGTSFTANWKPVEGADKYKLNVFAIDASTNEPDYLLKDVEVDGNSTSYEVTRAISGRTYYYNVVACKGDNESLTSFDQRVYDLEAPVLNPVEKLGDEKYKATWDDVPGADVYNYYAMTEKESEKDEVRVLTNENFNGILDLDGHPTGFTKENPESVSYSEYYCREVKQQGWVGTNACPYDDYLALDAYHYVANGQLSAWMSPELDFSKDGGKFTVDVDLAANTTTMWDEDDNEYHYTTQACAVIFNWDEEAQEYIQAEICETWNTDPVEFDWKHYTFHFTKGAERTKFAICAVQSYDNLYIDNLKITQNYKAGEKFVDPFLYKRFYGSREGETPTEIEVTIPWWGTGGNVYHQVSAFSRQADKYQQSYDDRESKYSTREHVFFVQPSGVQDVIKAESNVTRMANRIVIANPEGKAVSVYTLNGECLMRTAETSSVVTLSNRGAYIVRVGEKTYKVIY